MMEKETKLGTLIVEDSNWSSEGWLGYKVSIRSGNNKTTLALIEVDQSDPRYPPTLKVHVYDPNDNDPAFRMVLGQEELN